LRLSVTKLGELIAETYPYCREFWSINDFILRNWGVCVDTVLDTYPGSVECGSARQSNGYWSAEGLPMRAVADEKTVEYG